MALEWLTAALPFIKDAKVSDVLREQVNLLVLQRDDAIREIDKADAEMRKAKENIGRLEIEVSELKEKLKVLQPASNLRKEAEKILVQLFSTPHSFTTQTIARGFKLELSVCQYHLDSLSKLGLVDVANWVKMDSSPDAYQITSEGRAYVMDHGLA